MLHADFLCILHNYANILNFLTVKTNANEQKKYWQFSNPKYICILNFKNIKLKVGHGNGKLNKFSITKRTCVCMCVCV